MLDRYNKFTIGWQLSKALAALISADSKVDEYSEWTDEIRLGINLGFAIGKLCLAWHGRSVSPEEDIWETQDEFEILSSSVPNWGGRFKLVDAGALYAGIDPSVQRRRVLNKNTIHAYLRAAEAALRDFAGAVDAGGFDYCEAATLGSGFEPILHRLCLAWYLRYLDAAEISSLDPAVIEDLESWLPPSYWSPAFRLVSLEESPGEGAGAGD